MLTELLEHIKGFEDQLDFRPNQYPIHLERKRNADEVQVRILAVYGAGVADRKEDRAHAVFEATEHAEEYIQEAGLELDVVHATDNGAARMEITGTVSLDEAQNLADALQEGSFPYVSPVAKHGNNTVAFYNGNGMKGETLFDEIKTKTLADLRR